jgi:tetratricopeptide (TPR) repeat protein
VTRALGRRYPVAMLGVRYALSLALTLAGYLLILLMLRFDLGEAALVVACTGLPWGAGFWLRFRSARDRMAASPRQLWACVLLHVLPILAPLWTCLEYGREFVPAEPTMLVAVPLLLAASRRSVELEERNRLSSARVGAANGAQARRLIAMCESELGKAGDDPDRRGWLELNLANALYLSLTDGYRQEDLERAVEILDRLADQDPSPLRRCLAAASLIDAADAFERAEGDVTALEEATRRYIAAAQPLMHLPGIPFRVRYRQAESLLAKFAWHVSRHVDGASDAEATLGLARDAVQAYRQAAGLASREERAEVVLKRIVIEAWLYRIGLDDRPPSVDEFLRAADELPRREGPLGAVYIPLLAQALIEGGTATAGELDRAERHIRAALKTGATDPLMAIAVEEALALIIASRPPDEPHRDRRVSEALRHFSRAYEYAQSHDPWRATRIAMLSGRTAADHGLVEEAIRCYRNALETARRLASAALTWGQSEQRMHEAQGAATAAADLLITRGRYREAVVMLESGRASLITEAVERERVEARLRAHGHQTVADRYRRVVDRLRRQEILAAGHGEATMFTLTGRARRALLAEARNEWESLVAEIRALDGFGRFLAAPTYDEIRQAATIVPLVYLVATESGGYALVMTGGADPEVVRLPGLVIEDVSNQVGAFRQALALADDDPAGEAVWHEVLADTLAWTLEVINRPLAAAVGSLRSVTLIPIGLLTALPLHAAPGTIDDLTITYSPNARVLTDVAQRLPAAGTGHLLVADAGRPPAVRLNAIDEEIRAIRRWFPRTRVLMEPQPEDVLAELSAYDAYHFACHGMADHDDPLRSGLLVGGGLLTVKDLLARRLPGARLAVLSACESGVAGGPLSDEVTGLPSALLQAGVAGVIGTLWKVDDFATLLIVTRLYELWGDGLPPPEALRRAQVWLRDSSLADLLTYTERTGTPWPRRLTRKALREADRVRPYAHPDYWAAFAYTGI